MTMEVNLYSLRRSQQRRQVVNTLLEPRDPWKRCSGQRDRTPLFIDNGGSWLAGTAAVLSSEGRSTDSLQQTPLRKLTGRRDEFYNVNLSIPNHPRVLRV